MVLLPMPNATTGRTPWAMPSMRSWSLPGGVRQIHRVKGWALECFPKRTEAAIRAHVILTLLTFTLVNAFCSAAGQTGARRGMRRWRAEEVDQTTIVLAGGHYAILAIEEVFIPLGVVPTVCLRADPDAVRRKYGLPRAA